MAAHRFADRQGEALAIALYVADQIPLIDDADHAAILQNRQLGDVIQPHAGKDRGQGVVRRGRDGSAFVMAQGDKITEIALFGAGDQSLLAHPVVVEHFGQVFIAAVAGEGHHPLRTALRPAVAQRGAEQGAGGRAGQHALNLQQLARGVERFAVADAIRGMYPLQPGQRRDKIFADPFDQPGSRFAVASGIDLIGKDGTRRIGENKFRFRRVLSKPGLKPTQRAAGADADDDGVDVALQLLIKLRRSGGGMGQRIGVVIKLVDIKGARRFIGKAAGIILVVGRVAFIDVGAGEQHRRAQRPQVKDFLAAHFVRHHQDQAVIFLRRNQRQTEAGIAGGGFDNRSPGRQFSLALGFINHRQRNPIFN